MQMIKRKSSPRNTHEKLFPTHEISTTKKNWGSRITREKFLTHEIPTGYTKLSRRHDDTMALHPREPR